MKNPTNKNKLLTKNQSRYWKAICQSQQQSINGGWPNVRPKADNKGGRS